MSKLIPVFMKTSPKDPKNDVCINGILGKRFWCKLGIHSWAEVHYSDADGSRSSAWDWRCRYCGKPMPIYDGI